MATVTAATAVVGAGVGVAKYFQGRKMQRDAQKKIDNFEWEDHGNAYSNLEVSRLGADLQMEEVQKLVASNIEVSQQGGTRAVLAGTQAINETVTDVNRKIAADLDQQQKGIDFAEAADNVRLREMYNQRQADELAGYGQEKSVGMGMKYDGLAETVNSSFAAGHALKNYGEKTGHFDANSFKNLKGFDKNAMAKAFGLSKSGMGNLTMYDLGNLASSQGKDLSEFKIEQ